MPDNPQKPSTADAPAGGQARWSYYLRAEASGVRKWARRAIDRDNVVQGVKTFAWVGPLTLLIWVYAEREQEYTVPSMVISFELRSSDPSRIVTLQQSDNNAVDPRVVIDTGNAVARQKFSGNVGQLIVELTGPKVSVQKVKEYLDGGERLKLEIDRVLIPTGRSSPLDPVRLLNNVPEIRDKGVVVQRASPAQLFVYVDEIIEEEREVLAAPDVTNLVGNPTFDPSKVILRGPRQDIESPAGKAVRAYAELSPFTQKPGEPMQTTVGIRQPSNSRLEFKPTSVHATFVVRESDVPGTIRQMPVWVSAAPGLADKYRWEIGDDGQMYNVKVVGPPDVIAALEKEQIKPRAIVFLTREDVVNSIGIPKQFPVRFDLPENVRGTGEDPKRTVSITVGERTGADGT